MVDIHSHILPGLDDGSKTLGDSVAMLKIAAESGTTDIVASPHANLTYTFDPDTITKKIEELTKAAGPVPRIHRGCDFHLSYDNIQDAIANPAKYTINHKNYLLVEFSDLLIFKNTGEIFDWLVGAGMIPIITHPERNMLLHQRLPELKEWVAKGCLLQVTGLSFLGRFGRRAEQFSKTLMREGLVQIVASDAHDPEDRTPDLAGPFEEVASRFGEAWAERLFETNPRCTLTGDPIDLAPPPQAERTRKWFQFWK
jgi:protein-tyrosine phosphatase